MRILVLNYEFPPLGGGGGQASADLCRELARSGHSLWVLSSLAPGLRRYESRDGYQILRVFCGRRSLYRASFTSMAGYLIAGLLPGLRLIRLWKPDVIHAHFAVPTGALANALSRLTGRPYVLTAHLGDVPGGVPEKTDRWFRWVYRWTPPIWIRAASVVAVSSYTRSLALQHYPVEIQVIPNGIELPDAGSLNDQVSDPPRLLFAGRFQPQKNLPFLIDVLARMAEQPWTCTLLGDGPTREQVEQRVRDQGLHERIRLAGWVPHASVLEQLRRSDILVMPSRSEGLPVVGIQALAHGLAVVASRAGGLVDLVQDQVNGRLCEVGDGACFQSALRWCLQDRDRLRELKRASRRLAEGYDIRRVAAAYQSVLSQAAG